MENATTISTKSCGRCKEIKPLADFMPITNRGKRCLSSYCRPCASKQSAASVKTHRDRRNKYRKEWRRQHPEQAKQMDARSRRRKLQNNPALYKQDYERAVQSGYRAAWIEKNYAQMKEYWTRRNDEKSLWGPELTSTMRALKQLIKLIEDGKK